MPSDDVIVLLGGWEGYRVGVVQRFAAGDFDYVYTYDANGNVAQL